MRDAIITMCLARLGDPPPSFERVLADPALAEAMLRLLRDCQPLLVIRELIEEVEAARRG